MLLCLVLWESNTSICSNMEMLSHGKIVLVTSQCTYISFQHRCISSLATWWVEIKWNSFVGYNLSRHAGHTGISSAIETNTDWLPTGHTAWQMVKQLWAMFYNLLLCDMLVGVLSLHPSGCLMTVLHSVLLIAFHKAFILVVQVTIYLCCMMC